jgi:hypothetical protein
VGKDLGAGEDEGLVIKSNCFFFDLSTQQDGVRRRERGREGRREGGMEG